MHVGVGSDRQPKLQDHIHVGQRSHDHSTHPEERGGGGWYIYTVFGVLPVFTLVYSFQFLDKREYCAFSHDAF